MDDPCLRFLLVHGTFSDPRTWDMFAQTLHDLHPNIIIDRWPWSAENDQIGRNDWSRLLAADLNARSEPVFLIGHSHGGNICRSAASQARDGQVLGIAYVATPFLEFDARKPKDDMPMFGYVLGACAALFMGLFYFLEILIVQRVSTATFSPTTRVIAALGVLLISAALAVATLRLMRIFSRLTRLRAYPLGARALKNLLRAYADARARNWFAAPEKIPQLVLHTAHDEALWFLRGAKFAAFCYKFLAYGIAIQLGLLGVASIMFWFGVALSATIALPLTMYDPVAFQFFEPISNKDIAPTLVLGAAILNFVIVGTGLGVVLTCLVNWFFLGRAWNFGFRPLRDLLFLKMKLRPYPATLCRRMDIPTKRWNSLMRPTLRHCAILNTPETAREVLAWALDCALARTRAMNALETGI